MIPLYTAVSWEVSFLEFQLPSLLNVISPPSRVIYVNSREDYSFYATGRYRQAFVDVQDYPLEARLFTALPSATDPQAQDVGAWFTPTFADDERAYIGIGPGTSRQLSSADIGRFLCVKLRIGGASGITVTGLGGRAIIG